MNFSNIINYFINNQDLEDISAYKAIAITYFEHREVFRKIEVTFSNNSIYVKSNESRIFTEMAQPRKLNKCVYVLLHESLKSIREDFAKEFGEDLSFSVYPPTIQDNDECTMEYSIYRHLKAHLNCPDQIKRGSMEQNEFISTAIQQLYIFNKQIDLFLEC